MDRIAKDLLTGLICIVALGQVVQVVTRHMLQIPVMGLEETMLYPTLWLSILGAVNASHENGHIGPRVAGAILHHQDGHVTPLRLLRALAGDVRGMGGRVLTGQTVTAILAAANGQSPEETSYLRIRPPLKPVTLGEIEALDTPEQKEKGA